MSHYIDLAGQVFGYVTVLSKLPTNGSTHATWKCLCVCGREIEASARDLKRTKNKSCGCKNPHFNKGSDITGNKYGRLTAIRKTEKRNKYKQLLWECLCDCGNTHYVWVGSLTQGHVKSCGCFYPYAGDKDKKRIRKIWQGMIDRCYNPERISYKIYGAKGITVCDEWLNNFDAFYRWSINNGYKPGLTIDRFPNKTGPYSPDNCRWATYVQQANNRTNSTLLTLNGQTRTIAEWSPIVNISQYLISQRIRRLKWSVEDALTKPVKTKKYAVI